MYQSTKSFLSQNYRLLCVALATLAMLTTTGCATHYVDTSLKDIPPEKMAKVQDPKPVQLLFEFQTKGATNPRATDNLKTRVSDIVQKSGLFSQVAATPVSNGAVLNIVVNNVPLTDNAAAKGFATGLTLGLAGNTVTDGYICTIDYIPSESNPKISRTVRHAIHTTLGASGAPVNAIKSASVQDAIDTMLKQIVSNGLNDVASDTAFK